MLNCQSVCNKLSETMEHVIDHDADVMFLSETWLRSMKNDITAAVRDYGYTLHHCIRMNRSKELGGGVGILVKRSLNTKPIKVKQYQAFEHCVVKILIRKVKNFCMD